MGITVPMGIEISWGHDAGLKGRRVGAFQRIKHNKMRHIRGVSELSAHNVEQPVGKARVR
jgi:hypothetical protein